MLQITLATAADAGEYVCSASNSAGSRQMSATVYVQGKVLKKLFYKMAACRLKGQYRHDKSTLSTGHGIYVLVY